VLGDHLDEMVRSRVRLVVIAVVVVSVVGPVIVSGAFSNASVKIAEVSFRQEMVANVNEVKDEQQHRQDTQPPGGRSRFDGPSA
jgi:hypothetical protein